MPAPALDALTAAWQTIVIGLALLGVVLAAAPYWDGSTFLSALQKSLSDNPY